MCGDQERQEKDEAMEKAMEDGVIYSTPTPTPGADATWLEIKELEVGILYHFLSSCDAFFLPPLETAESSELAHILIVILSLIHTWNWQRMTEYINVTKTHFGR